jgi:enoyl-CoA hydratase
MRMGRHGDRARRSGKAIGQGDRARPVAWLVREWPLVRVGVVPNPAVDTVRVEGPDEAGVAVLRVQRPPLNALAGPVLAEVHAAAEGLDADARGSDPRVRAVVVTGGERIFSAGVDDAERAAWPPDERAERLAVEDAALQAVADLPVPTIAAIRGWALGAGLALALACDLRVCGDDSRLGSPEVARGLVPSRWLLRALPAVVGPSRATALVLGGAPVDALEALRIGLVDRVVAPDGVHDAATAWARSLAEHNPHVVHATMQALRAAGAASETRPQEGGQPD